MAKSDFVLPVAIVGPADANRVLLELQMLDDIHHATAAARDGAATATKKSDVAAKLPKVSRLIDSLAEANSLDAEDAEDRRQLIAFLESLRQHAPVLHISFASEPSSEFTARIIGWMRENISKYVLVNIGLQPSIAAGCIIRSTNKVFDMSLRRHLDQKRSYLMDLMHQKAEGETA